MKKTIWLVVVVVALGAGAELYYNWLQGRKPPETVRQEVSLPTMPPRVSVEPAIRHPLETAPTETVPALNDSDPAMQEALTGLFGKKRLAKYFYLDGVVRRIVATIDNLPRKTVAQRLMPVKPVPGMFAVGKDADEALVVAAKNAARYVPYVRIMQAVDARKLVALYVELYPLFQQAYKELGYPNGYFNDRLIEAIDDMLEAPGIDGPIKLLQPKVLYEFADPALEARSAGQKIVMRMGSENAARVKEKLREIRREVTLRAPKPPEPLPVSGVAPETARPQPVPLK